MSYGHQFDDLRLYRELFKLLGNGLTATIILVGFRLGTNADMKNEYRGYLQGMWYSWVSSILMMIPLVLIITDEMWSSAVWMVLQRSIFNGYGVGAVLFSSMTLGWLVDEKPVFERKLNKMILKPVLTYNGALLAQSLFQQ